MRGINRVLLMGNLGADVEVKHSREGTPIASFNIAVSEKWKGKDGEDQERVEWVKIVCFSGVAENCGKYLGKGDTVVVEGRLRSREFEDREGNKKKITEVIGDRIYFVSLKRKGPESPDDNVPF